MTKACSFDILKLSKMPTMVGILLLLVSLFAVLPAKAASVYMTQDQFLTQAFKDVPAAKTYWIQAADKARGLKLLGHPVAGLRTRYWQVGNKTAWVINEIGKEQPITIGVVVEGGKVDFVDILTYRESRGYEVRHDFFTRQFKGAALKGDKLTKRIDGISGATLSVWAVTNVSEWALYLHAQALGPK